MGKYNFKSAALYSVYNCSFENLSGQSWVLGNSNQFFLTLLEQKHC